jgi:hypothetical protein
MTVTSATAFAAGNLCQVGQEFVRISKTYTSGTTIPLDGRGLNGGVVIAHASGENVSTTSLTTDFANPAPQGVVPYPITSPGRQRAYYAAAGAITLPTPGNDMVAIILGTNALAMTIAAPTKDMDGSMLFVLGNAAAAHTIQFTGGFSGAGGSYDVITVNATAPIGLIAMAVNGLWETFAGPAFTGTVTNITGGIA